MPAFDPEAFAAQINVRKTELNKANADLNQVRSQITALTNQRNQAAAGNRRLDILTINRQIATATAERDRLVDAVRQAGARWRGDVYTLLPDACDASAATPLLLLPVRIETRFATIDGKPILRVRIYPDAIHIDQLRRTLTDAEREAGDRYWGAQSADGARERAWADLVAAVGGRAAWVADRREPAKAGHPDVGESDERGAVARLLPDRFVVEVIQNGKVIREIGKAIGPDPVMGLFGDDEDESALVVTNGIPVAPGAEWIVDYAEAEKIGLAVSVKLGALAPVERVMVFGTRASHTAAQTAAEVAALFQAHRYASDLALVPVGTPTNNLDDQRSGYVPSMPAAPVSSTASVPDSDGARFAAALGIDSAILADVRGADRQSDNAAWAANVLFWWPTWGTVLDLIDTNANDMKLQIWNGELEWARRFHYDHVRGRGPLPSIRVNKQPYGLLPVGQVDRLAFADRLDPFALPGRVGRGIQKVALAARNEWRVALAGVPRLGVGDADKTMLELLGMSPVSFGLRARIAFAAHALNIAGAPTDAEALEQVLNSLVVQQATNRSAEGWPIASLAKKANPVPLPYAHETDGSALTTLAAGGGIAEPKSVLQAFAVLAMQHARRRSAASPVSALHKMNDNLAGVAATPRVVRPSVESAQEAASKGSKALLAMADQALEPEYAQSTQASYQPEQAGRKSFVDMAHASRNIDAKREFSMQALHEIMLAMGFERQAKEALERLAQADLSLDDRRILVGEALDVASHRLDAWLTGLIEYRRRELRAKTPTGLQVGAFGWAENVRPAKPKDASELGFIHAPSMAHAATAGVLRAAYLAHAREQDGGGFAIDLSSRRARLAMDLLAACREGQTLGQALGYRVERMMQDSGLGQFILAMRSRYPGKQGQLTDAGEPLDPATQASVAGSTLTDGVKFVDEIKKKGADFVTSQIVQNPAGKDGKTFAEVVAWVVKALDATSDLLMAESVHQLTQGNSPRAAAAMDAIKGDAPAPEPTVLGTGPPTSVLVHRLMLVLGAGSGWPTKSQRAVAAPRLEAWAASHLGPPDRIVVAANPAGQPMTLAQADISALDLVYEAGDRHGLFERLRAKLVLGDKAAPADAPIPGTPTDWRPLGEALELADALRRTLLQARLATPADLTGPSAEKTRTADVSLPSQLLTKARNALRNWIETLDDSNQSAAKREAAIASLAEFGIRAPANAAPLEAAKLVLAKAKQRDEAATKVLQQTPQTEDTVAEAAQALFGLGFRMPVPLSPTTAVDDWSSAVAAASSVVRPPQLRRWLSDMGSVRPEVGRHLDLLMMAEAFGYKPALGLAQFLKPEVAAATVFAGDHLPGDIVATCLLDQSGAVEPAGPIEALVIDEFVEPIVDRGTRSSGIAFNAPAAGARPPQSMLLAIAPDDKRWTTERLSATLSETIELAKLRGVTLERQIGAPRLLPAIYTQSWSLQGEAVLDFAALAGAPLPFAMRYVKDSA